MLHDKTFCLQALNSECCNKDCYRFITERERYSKDRLWIGEFHNPKIGLRCKEQKSCIEELDAVA